MPPPDWASVANSMSAGETREPYLRKLRTLAQNAEHEQSFYVRALQQHFRPGMRWLDAGCGHSLIPRWLRGAGEIEQKFLTEAGWIVGVDVDWKSLTLPSQIRRVACDLETLAFPENTFDLITCNMVAEHLTRPLKVFQEFFRVLKPPGLVLVLTPNLYHWANLISRCTPYVFHRLILKALWKREPADVFPTYYHCNTARALREQLNSVGFGNVTIYKVPGRPRLVDFGPLFYPEWMLYRLSLRFPSLRDNLFGVAQKLSMPTTSDELETGRHNQERFAIIRGNA